MARLIAFLRGINVGGNSKVSMEELTKVFASLGFENIKTVLQTGNVLFDAQLGYTPSARIEAALREQLGITISVMTLPLDDLRTVLDRDPFCGRTATEHIKLYMAVLSAKPVREPILPQLVPTKEGDVELISRSGLLVFTAGYEKDGRFGFPNAVVEKLYGVPATSRNFNTIEKLLK